MDHDTSPALPPTLTCHGATCTLDRHPARWSVAGGDWSVTGDQLLWTPHAGQPAARLKLHDGAMFSREGRAVWVAQGTTLSRVTPTDIRTYEIPDGASGAGHKERHVIVDSKGFSAFGAGVDGCVLPLDHPHLRGIAFDGKRAILYGNEVLSIDVLECRVRSVTTVSVDAVAFTHDRVALSFPRSGHIRTFTPDAVRPTQADATLAHGRLQDGPRGPVYTRDGYWDLNTGAHTEATGGEIPFPGGMLRVHGRRVDVLDGAGNVVRTESMGKVVTPDYVDAIGDTVLVADAMHGRILGGPSFTFEGPALDVNLLDATHVRADVIGPDLVPVGVIHGADGSVQHVPAHLRADAAGVLSVSQTALYNPWSRYRLVSDGTESSRVVDGVTGHAMGVQLPVMAFQADVSPDAATVVTLTGTNEGSVLTAWEVATGRTLWAVPTPDGQAPWVGRSFAVAGKDVVDVSTGREVWRLGDDGLTSVADGTSWHPGDAPPAVVGLRPSPSPVPPDAGAFVDPFAARVALQELLERGSAATEVCPYVPAWRTLVAHAGGGLDAAVVAACNPLPPPPTPKLDPRELADVYAFADGTAVVASRSLVWGLDRTGAPRWVRSGKLDDVVDADLLLVRHLGAVGTTELLRPRDGARVAAVTGRPTATEGGTVRVRTGSGLEVRVGHGVRRVADVPLAGSADDRVDGWTCTGETCSFGTVAAPGVVVGRRKLRLHDGKVIATEFGRQVWTHDDARELLPTGDGRALVVARGGSAEVLDGQGRVVVRYAAARHWACAGGVAWAVRDDGVERIVLPHHAQPPQAAPSSPSQSLLTSSTSAPASTLAENSSKQADS